MKLSIIPVHGLPELTEGDDLATLIAGHTELQPGDVVVVAQKAISKVEGRLIPVDPARRNEERARLAAQESVRVLARRGDLTVVQTRHGFVCAHAGVDASNVPPDRLALLPLDPDGSAEALRARLRALTGTEVGVIVSDTFGRPWRMGQTNVALGVAGIHPLRDHRGEKDAFGATLEATTIAIADELAGAAELVMGKSDGIPVAIVRGLEGATGDGTARVLLRPPHEDLFPAGTIELIEARRSIRSFAPHPVPEEVVARAVAAAATAPTPHGSRIPRPWRFVWLRSPDARTTFLTALAEAWRRDLTADGVPEATITQRLARSNSLLADAPVLLACFVSTAGADPYDDGRHARAPERARAERDMFIAAAGAAIQNCMLALSAQSVASCWISSTLFCPPESRTALNLDTHWNPTGCIAAGYPTAPLPLRGPTDPKEFLDVR